MKSIARLVILSSLLGSFGGCVNKTAQQDIQRLRMSIEDMRSLNAENTSKITSLETELRQLSGRLDEFEHRQTQRFGSLTTLQNDLTSLQRRVPPPPLVPIRELEEDEARLAVIPRELALVMDEAFLSLREGNYDRAEQVLSDGVSLSSGTEFAPMVLFWRAIAFEGLNDNRRAIETYHEIASNHPQYSRVPVALLRQGSVLIRSGDKRTARIIFSKVIADFPRTEEATKAKERLKDVR